MDDVRSHGIPIRTQLNLDSTQVGLLAVTPILTGALFRLPLGIWTDRIKYAADDFPESMGVVSGIVGMAGGLGGFLLPIMFGAILDRLGVNSSCFMASFGCP